MNWVAVQGTASKSNWCYRIAMKLVAGILCGRLLVVKATYKHSCFQARHNGGNSILDQ